MSDKKHKNHISDSSNVTEILFSSWENPVSWDNRIRFTAFPLELLHMADTLHASCDNCCGTTSTWLWQDCQRGRLERCRVVRGRAPVTPPTPRPRVRSRHRSCPAAVRAVWCKGTAARRPLLVSTVINSSILLPETCAPSLISTLLQTITAPVLHFSVSRRL